MSMASYGTVGCVGDAEARFQALLQDFDLARIQSHPHSIYGLWPDLSLAYVNPAWYRFARENGGGADFEEKWSPGRDLFEGMPRVLHDFFKTHYRLCLQTGRPWWHTYECSSPEHHRLYRMEVLPIGNEQGLLVVNSLIVEEPHNRAGRLPMQAAYCNREGVIVQCAHCRRVQRTADPSTWDWVPQWVGRPPQSTSHGLCHLCVGFYYQTTDQDFHSLRPIVTGESFTELTSVG